MAEGTFKPDWFSRPGDTVGALMDRHGISANDLVERLGCGRDTVRSLLAGLTAIDDRLAIGLAETVGGTVEFWRKRQVNYQRSLDRVAENLPAKEASDWVRQIPISRMVSSGWIGRPAGREEALRSCLAYFGVTRPEEWRIRFANVTTDVAFRKSATFEASLGPLSVWLRQAEIEASMMTCEKWNSQTLRAGITALRKLTLLRKPSMFLPKLRSICANSGVALVVLRAPPGCPASGAARFMSIDRAMIVLSFRHLSEDHFWFTFFHEVGHLLLHDPAVTFVDSEVSVTNDREREANAFAETTLVPVQYHAKLKSLGARREAVLRFAALAEISPGIVVGQMQHRGLLGHASLNYLKRRYTWDDIDVVYPQSGGLI